MDLKEQVYIAVTTHPKYNWRSAKSIAAFLERPEKEINSILMSLVGDGRLVFHPDPQFGSHLFGAPEHVK